MQVTSLLIALLLSQADAGAYDPFARDRAQRENLAKMRQRYEQAAAEANTAEEALSKACGEDYLTLRVGMTWKRAKQCGGGFSLVGQDTTGKLYQFNGVAVRVAAGKITAVLNTH